MPENKFGTSDNDLKIKRIAIPDLHLRPWDDRCPTDFITRDSGNQLNCPLARLCKLECLLADDNRQNLRTPINA